MALLLTTVLAFSLTACSGKKDENAGVPTGEITFDVPEGFELVDESTPMYYGPGYPEDTSNINVMKVENDPVGVKMSEKSYIEAIETTYSSQFQLDVTVEVQEFTKTEIDGYDALIVEATTSLDNGVQVSQLQYLISIDGGSITVTYTESQGFDWMDDFRKSMDTIKLVYEEKE